MADSVTWTLEGWDEAIAEVKRVSNAPDFRIVREFERVFDRLADDVDAKVHVITGSLKASGKRDTDYVLPLSAWSGKLEYGGPLVKDPTPGPPIDPVGHAIYERNRGGDHDFFRDIPLWYDDFQGVITDWLTPGHTRARRVT